MALRNQQIVNDCTGKADPIIIKALCHLNDEIVGLRHENKEKAEVIDKLSSIISKFTGVNKVTKVRDILNAIRCGTEGNTI